jgi:nucleotide-binding universal stress UspA family protein
MGHPYRVQRMKKVLIAVDDTNNAKAVLSAFYGLPALPEEAVLLYVNRLEGRTLMIDMLGKAELETLKEALEGTGHKEELDREAERVLCDYRKRLEDVRFSVRALVGEGVPAEEIARVAEEEGVELIILGFGGNRGVDRIISGDVARDLKRHVKVPVYTAGPGGRINESIGPLLFLTFWSCLGIYYVSGVLMDTLGKKLVAPSEGLPVLVSYYVLYMAGVAIAGIMIAVIGGIMGRLLQFYPLRARK